MSRPIKNLYLESKIEDEWTSLLSSSTNLIESKVIYNAITALSTALDDRIKILEDKHSVTYQVDGEDKETLAAAITTLNNNNGGTLTLKKNASVSETDGTTQIPSITAANVTIDGNGKTLTIKDSVNSTNGVFSFIPNQSAIKFKASEGDTSVSRLKIKDLTINSSKTAIYAKVQELSVEGVTINGSSTDSLIKMGDGAKCKLVSVVANNSNGSILESTTTTGVASFYMNGCTFDGGENTIISDSTESNNTYVFDGGTYNNFSLPENENAKLCATFLNGQQVTDDELLSTGISSEFTFKEGTEISDFTDKVLDQNLPQYPMEWYVKRNEENNSYQIYWNEAKVVGSVQQLIDIRQRVLSGDCCEGERFVQTEDISDFYKQIKHGLPELSGYWDGIGLKNGNKPVLSACFKGMYNGNGYGISNLMFNSDSNDHDLYGLFRAVSGAYITNLEISVGGNGFAPELLSNNTPCAKPTTGCGGAAFVGTAIGGCRIENCVAKGQFGSADHPTGHTTTGILGYINDTKKTNANDEYILTNVRNDIDIYGSRKIGGICGYVQGRQKYTNVENRGNMTSLGIISQLSNDGNGGIFGYMTNNKGTKDYPCVTLSNVSNYGVISSASDPNYKYTGQFAGIACIYHCDGDTEGPWLASTIDGNNYFLSNCVVIPNNGVSNANFRDLNVWYGETGTENTIKLVKPEISGTYKAMYNVDELNKPKQITLEKAGDYVILDESLVTETNRGRANVYYNDTQITGTLIKDTIYKYTAG